MFSKFSNQPETPDTSDLEAALSEKEQEIDAVDTETSIDDTELTLGKSIPLGDETQTVQTVEKISGIVSPYFIVIVGLLLSEQNFFIGIILIFVGIFSLLKLSWQDIERVLESILNFFQSQD